MVLFLHKLRLEALSYCSAKTMVPTDKVKESTDARARIYDLIVLGIFFFFRTQLGTLVASVECYRRQGLLLVAWSLITLD